MERTQERPQLQIISRNDEIPDPAVVRPLCKLTERREEGEKIIAGFFNEVGLMNPQIEADKFDVRFLKRDLKSYRQRVLAENKDERDEIHRKFLHFLSIERVLGYCHRQLSSAITAVNRLAENEDINALKDEARTLEWNNAFLVASHWQKVDAILHRAFPVPDEKLLRLRASIADNSGTEQRQAAIYHLPTTR